MRVCSIKAPEPSVPVENASHSRPILVVRYLGQIEAYAVFRNGSYEFNLSTDIADAMDTGEINAEFQLDDGFPIGIVLARP